MEGLQMAIPTPTPSPGPGATTPTASINGANGSGSRRPPRKSTLTQQQKNQKRQRATQDQLVTLEMEFSKNPTPTATVRERIAQEINMTERSVQIWFQNRRAKIKTLVKRNIETGEDCDNIPDSMRKYLQMQAMEMGKGLGSLPFARAGGPLAAYGSGSMLLNDSNPSKVVIQHFTCRSLSIGSWRRIGQAAMDLVIFYSPDRSTVTYYINNDSAGYKIEYPFSYIKNITLETGDMVANAEGAAHRPGGLVIELNRAPHFFMDSSGSGGFYQCGDFTEDLQASNIKVHHLGGHPKVLSGQLAKLVSLESFQHRHSMPETNSMAVQSPPGMVDMNGMPMSATHSLVDPNTIAASAPVSPMGNFRPASQPNHLVHPRNMHMFNENHNLMMPPRGHKRQRSRSVPVAIDFNMLRNNPMPSFFIQHEQQAPAPMADPNIFAPIPQHQHAHGFAPGPLGPNLHIDTSAGYGMDFGRPPMSATTLNSPSEFGTPAFFNSTGAPSDNASTLAPAQTPYTMSHLSPIPDHSVMPSSHSPLSAASPAADPVIANSSPPLTSFDRNPTEQDFFSLQHHQKLDDEAFNFGDLYAKQNFTLPFRGPLEGESAQDFQHHSPQLQAGQPQHMQPNQLAPPFGTIDPSSLSPGHPGMSG